MEKANRDDVAVFVDFENVYVSVREKFDASPNFEVIMDRCEDYGRIVIARAYADWYRYPRVTSALFANGVEPMYVPTYYYDRDIGRTGRPIKNSVDIHLCIDAMRTLFTQPNIRKFVLVTGDRDFIPLVNAIRQNGKDVIIIGIGGAASAHLAQSADEFLFYEQLADLKAPGASRPVVEEPRRSEDRREKAERPERSKLERAQKAEAAPVIPEPVLDVPIEEPAELIPVAARPAVEAAPPPRNPYETLVEAVRLARQRGFVVNLGSLKVVMRELDSNFHESKVKDSNGRGFGKFKDFVKEAERRGNVQIFTNGTVTEVFLAGEDPKEMSQFSEDLITQQAERELETELAQADQQIETEQVTDIEMVAPEPIELSEVVPELVDVPTLPDLDVAEVTPAEEAPVTTFGDREWDVFRASMSEFAEPVRFADIFNALRGLRNQEVVELTNNELKELVKQGINRGILQRTGRGARAYYRLSSQYRVARQEMDEERAPEGTGDETVQSPSTIVDGAAQTPRRRRARSYGIVADLAPVLIPSPDDDLFIPTPAGSVESGADADLQASSEQQVSAEPQGDVTAPDSSVDYAPAAVTVPQEVEVVPEPETEKRQSRRRSRRKPAAEEAPVEDTRASATESPVAAAPVEAPKKRSRRKPAAAEAVAEVAVVAEQPEAARENGTKRRRRRKKPAENGGEGTES